MFFPNFFWKFYFQTVRLQQQEQLAQQHHQHQQQHAQSELQQVQQVLIEQQQLNQVRNLKIFRFLEFLAVKVGV